MKKCNSITVAVIWRANRFSSDLVHRHIIFPLTLLLLEKHQSLQYIIMQAVPMSKQANHVNIEPEILRGNWSSYWKYNEKSFVNPFTSCKTSIIISL